MSQNQLSHCGIYFFVLNKSFKCQDSELNIFYVFSAEYFFLGLINLFGAKTIKCHKLAGHTTKYRFLYYIQFLSLKIFFSEG